MGDRMLKSVLASVAVVALSAPAFAGGLAPAPEPVEIVPVIPAPQPTADWSGFYVGLHAGKVDLDIVESGDPTETLDGTYYGAHAGYMHDFGRLVAGGELRYTDVSDIVELDTLISANARLGYDLGRVLPFVSVGLGQLSTVSLGDDTGLLYGAGAEFAVTDRWNLGAEFTRYDFEDFNSSGIDLSGNLVGVRASFNF